VTDVDTPGPTAQSENREAWAELADLALRIAREIQFRGYVDERAVELTSSEGVVMRFLNRELDSTPTRIAAATGLQPTNLSAVLRRLEKKHLIERRASSRDRREVHVRATDHGKDNYRLVRHEWGSSVAEAADHDATDLAPALRHLARVEAVLEASRPAGAHSDRS